MILCCYTAGYSQAAEPSKAKISQNNYSKTIQLEGQKPIQKKKESSATKPTQAKAKAESMNDAPALQESEQLNESLEKATSNSYLQDPVHWFNSYTNKRNSYLSDDGVISKKEQEELGVVISESKSYISNSFEFNYINLRQNRNNAEAGKHLQEAIKTGGISNSLLLPEIAWIAERLGDVSKRNQALGQYESQGNLSGVQKAMATWSLNIVEPGSLIITNGEFDTYPLWLQQQKKNMHIVSLGMLEDADWLSKTLKSWNPGMAVPKNINSARSLIDFLLKQSAKPVYLSLSIRSGILSSYSSNLNPVGPLARLSSTSWNSTTALATFYLDASFQQYLKSGLNSNDPFLPYLANLLPGAFLLKTQLKAVNDPRASKAEEIYQQLKSITGKSIRQ
jgi:hypothetical protein